MKNSYFSNISQPREIPKLCNLFRFVKSLLIIETTRCPRHKRRKECNLKEGMC